MNSDLFADLQRHTHSSPDRHGEVHIACPACGHESSPKDPHCSFSERGFFCFVCGTGWSLSRLARELGMGEREYAPARWIAPEKRESIPVWQTLESPEAAQKRYESHPWRRNAWQAYKPLSDRAILDNHLGVGVLPKYSSRCPHDRLIVPVWWGSVFVGFRGRALDCDCGKWLATTGWDLERAPLYNESALRPGSVVWIVENPVDALLIGERSEYVGVATYSVSYWRDAWTEALQAARPELIVVAYDQDLPGNGGAWRRDELIRDWLANPKHKVVPRANGPRLTNDLLDAKLPVVLYDWKDAPAKADIGSMLIGAMA